MTERPTFVELQKRIQRDIKYFNGAIPERTALVWHGYLAALLEWGLMSIVDCDNLRDMLPVIEDNPVVAIMLGRSDES